MVKRSLHLTSTGRLARRLRVRLRPADGSPGWEPPAILTLNAWCENAWTDAWQETAPAPELVRMNLWRRITDSMPPPESLHTDLSLCRLLDETFETLIRHRLDPLSGAPSTSLVDWRRGISRTFRSRLAAQSFFHPSELPLKVADLLSRKLIPCPETIVLHGFESPAPIEQDLFAFLGSIASVRHGEEPSFGESRVEAFALPSRDQEVKYLVLRLADDVRSIPLHRIGVIVPVLDDYKAMIERDMKDVMGDNPPAGFQWYNITRGVPVSETALVRAALLPLRLALEGQPRELLTALICSPYYGCWAGRRHEFARADRVWRERGVERGVRLMYRMLRRVNPSLHDDLITVDQGLVLRFCGMNFREKKSVRHWISSLLELWDGLGFPVLSDEKDHVDRRHLEEIVHDMRRYLGGTMMDGYEFHAWFVHEAGIKTAQIRASEEAGIQIMGMIESRDIDFEKIYLIDMNDRSLPRPARPLPLLDSPERRHIQGGTAESQYRFARTMFDRITRQAPHIVLLRAEQDGTTPLAPSPFWPKSYATVSLDLWNEPDPMWLRASWLSGAFQGLARREDSAFSGKTSDADGDAIEETSAHRSVLSPARLKTALTCPYMYFAGEVLGIEPLEEFRSPVAPKERGRRLHRVLASFTKELRERDISPDEDADAAIQLLDKCIGSELADVAGDPGWQVERERWLDTGISRAPGLLRAWVDEEAAWRRDGWRTLAEEAAFEELSLTEWPFSVRGRIDRIDGRADGSFHLWDYKTGRVPAPGSVLNDFSEPQLPLYLLALKSGRVAGIPCGVGPLFAGYVKMSSLKDLKRTSLDITESHLENWKRIIAALGTLLRHGAFPARPYPLSKVTQRVAEEACVTCPFITLCVRGLKPKSHEEESHDGTDAEG